MSLRDRVRRLEERSGESGPIVVVTNRDDTPEERARTAAFVAEAVAAGRTVFHLDGSLGPRPGPPTARGDADDEGDEVEADLLHHPTPR